MLPSSIFHRLGRFHYGAAPFSLPCRLLALRGHSLADNAHFEQRFVSQILPG